mgnify:CR=1 FL=1
MIPQTANSMVSSRFLKVKKNAAIQLFLDLIKLLNLEPRGNRDV